MRSVHLKMKFFEDFIVNCGTLSTAELIVLMRSPRHVRLSCSSGEFCLLSTDMVTVAPQEEVGVIVSLPADGNCFVEGAEHVEQLILGDVRVKSYRYLVNIEFGVTSGVRIKFDDGSLTVLAGIMPYSIFVALSDKSWGAPEYPLSNYIEATDYKTLQQR